MTDSECSCLSVFLAEYGKCSNQYSEKEWLAKLDSFIEGWIWTRCNAAKSEALKALIEVAMDKKGRV